MEDSFSNLASKYRIRDTLSRRFIYSQIEKGVTHFTSLLDRCTPVGIDPSTVYRNVDLFRKLGLVCETGVGKNRYVQLPSDTQDHFHHMRCENCSKTISFDDEILEGLLKTIAVKNGFSAVSSHTIEMLGVCTSCRIIFSD